MRGKAGTTVSNYPKSGRFHHDYRGVRRILVALKNNIGTYSRK